MMTSKSHASRNLVFRQKYIDLESKAKSKGNSKSVNETNYGLGNVGTIADISENAYYFISIGDDPVNSVSTSVNVRLRYIDN